MSEQAVAQLSRQISVFLLDDHEVVRRGVRDMVETAPDLTVIGEASTAAEALAAVPSLRPDVAVLDVRLPDGDGVTVCRELRSQMPELVCLMLTSFADDEALFEAIMAGASGYVLKQIRGGDLVNAIRTVASGQSMLDAGTTAQVMERLRTGARAEDPLSALTEQERRILDLIGEGLTNRQIGERLFLAEKTVKNYVSSLLGKLGMQRRTQAAVMVSRTRHSMWVPDGSRLVSSRLPPLAFARTSMLRKPLRRPVSVMPIPSSSTSRVTSSRLTARLTST
jgi:DNA-binding NarL/FixJ family response regulator